MDIKNELILRKDLIRVALGEKEADLFALKVTKNKDVFVSLMEKLAEKNLADPNPSKFIKVIFYSHPPIKERIEMAKDFLID